MSRRTAAVAAVACTTLLLAGCSSGHASSAAGPASSAAVASNTIVIKNFAFQPANLTVAPGTKVTVTNEDSATHTVTATGAKAFDTGDIAPGKSATFTAPTTPAAYAYICGIHQYMQGTLTVTSK
jgi:plastocyanin